MSGDSSLIPLFSLHLVPEPIDWRDVACRMDDAANEGLPVWHYLDADEIDALCRDRADPM